MLGKAVNLNDFLEQADGEGYGPLQKDPDGILDLPKEFSYTIFPDILSRWDNFLSSGYCYLNLKSCILYYSS